MLMLEIAFSQVTENVILNDSIKKNTDFDYLELKGFEVLEVALVFNDLDKCDEEKNNLLSENVGLSKELDLRSEQVKQLVKAYYYGGKAIEKYNESNDVSKKIDALESKHIENIQKISDNYLKRLKKEKLKKNIYKFSFVATLIYLGKVIFLTTPPA